MEAGFNNPKVAVGIPAYNEEAHIAQVIVTARQFVQEVIVCDDGSSDLTGIIAEQMGAIVIRHDRNAGYGAALGAVFAKAILDGVDILVTLDADGQHDPRSIPKLVAPIAGGSADIVVGSRFLKRDTATPRYRAAGIKALSAMSNVVAYPHLTDAQSGFRAYSRSAAERVVPTEMGMGASVEILSRARVAKLRVVEIPVEIKYTDDSSTHNPIYHGIDVALAGVKHLSMRHPLAFYGIPGFLALVISGGFWYWTLSIFSSSGKVITNVTLIAVASTIVGLILMAVAVLLWVLISVIRERH